MTMEPFENNSNFQEDVGLFEAATHAVPVELPPVQTQSIVLALDGSDQDESARLLAGDLAERHSARLYELNGAIDAAAILAVAREQQADLLVVPVPFGRDYATLGTESLGSVIDMLLLEAPCPLLCTRAPLNLQEITRTFEQILVPISVGEKPRGGGLAWAFHLFGSQGRLALLAIADEDVLEEARQMMPSRFGQDAIGPDEITRSILRQIGGIVAAAQRQGLAQECSVHVDTSLGHFVPQVLARIDEQPQLVIWEAEQDHNSPSFHRAVDLLLASRGPVLITF